MTKSCHRTTDSRFVNQLNSVLILPTNAYQHLIFSVFLIFIFNFIITCNRHQQKFHVSVLHSLSIAELSWAKLHSPQTKLQPSETIKQGKF